MLPTRWTRESLSNVILPALSVVFGLQLLRFLTAGLEAVDRASTIPALLAIPVFVALLASDINRVRGPRDTLAFTVGGLALARGCGLADVKRGEPVKPDSLFRLVSISKPITAVAILSLVEEGRLDLDTPAFNLLDHLQPPPNTSRDPRTQDITVLPFPGRAPTLRRLGQESRLRPNVYPRPCHQGGGVYWARRVRNSHSIHARAAPCL